MKTSEFKLRIVNTINDLIDVYFAEDNIIDKLTNSTLKVLIDNNVDKLDDVISMFEDGNGNINAQTVICKYAEQIGDKGVSFDLKDYIKSDFIRGMLPNKSLIITKDDIYKIIPKEELMHIEAPLQMNGNEQ